MTGKPKSMSQIKQLLQLHEQGKGIKYIARFLGISRNEYFGVKCTIDFGVKCTTDS